MFNIVLHEPEKPDNTGNIGRTCVATGSSLHLIYPIGFRLTRSNIHHAGLDYWDRLKLYKHDNYTAFKEYFSSISKNERAPEHLRSESTSVVRQVPLRHEPTASRRGEATLWFATTKAHKSYTDVKFKDGDFIMFGKESAGIPEEILRDDEEHCIRIPMIENERSLNLSNSVAIILYEALRQNLFLNLIKKGELHKLKYKAYV